MPNPTLDYYNDLSSASRLVLSAALADPSLASKVHSDEIADIAKWVEILGSRPEATVLRNSTQELSFGLYALLTGSYRHAFASLRLALEQSLLFVHLSVNRLELAEWLSGGYDTNWAFLTGENGVFSPRYVRSFFPGLEPTAAEYCSNTRKLYRELSEFVHGNKASWELTPKKITFDKNLTEDWYAKASKAVDAITFALTLRFTQELDPGIRTDLADRIISRLGHIEPVRVAYGGVSNK